MFKNSDETTSSHRRWCRSPRATTKWVMYAGAYHDRQMLLRSTMFASHASSVGGAGNKVSSFEFRASPLPLLDLSHSSSLLLSYTVILRKSQLTLAIRLSLPSPFYSMSTPCVPSLPSPSFPNFYLYFYSFFPPPLSPSLSLSLPPFLPLSLSPPLPSLPLSPLSLSPPPSLSLSPPPSLSGSPSLSLSLPPFLLHLCRRVYVCACAEPVARSVTVLSVGR